MVDTRLLFSYFFARSQVVAGTFYQSFYTWYQTALQLCSPTLSALLVYLPIRSSLYRRLDPRKHEIRILTILPRGDHIRDGLPSSIGVGDDNSSTNVVDIHCILQTASLDDEPSYTALSYVWGTDDPSTTVLINGKPFLVRKNLAAALRQLQQTDHSLNIWIDAICINQDDNREKSHQIQIMAKIYESSVEALVWLGPAGDESDIAMERLERIGHLAIEAGMQDFRAADMANWYEPGGDERVCRIKSPLNELAAQEWLSLFHQSMVPLSKRDYWTRVWVVQEFSLARIVAIMCGSKRLSFTTFAAASNFNAFARWTLSTRVTIEDWLDPVKGPLIRSVSGNDHAPGAAPNVLIGARRRYNLETGEKESLRSLLQRTCILRPAGTPLNATDARDKIYGLMGLASDSKKLGILPDYSHSVTEVYADVSRAMIADGHTTILAWCQQTTGVEQFPSWVPDFSSHIREPCGEDHTAGALFCASGSTKVSQLSISPDAGRYQLRLLGTKIDTIAELGTAWEPLVNSPFNREGAQQLLNEVETFCDRSLLLSTPEQASDAKMRIPCADQAGHGASRSRAPSSIREEYELLRLPKTYTSDKLPSHLYEVAMGFQHDRKPFLSAEGYVGLVPAAATIGDIIIIIFGATIPFVVREIDGGKVQLIGEAFVYGIMDGEFLKVDRASESFCLC